MNDENKYREPYGARSLPERTRVPRVMLAAPHSGSGKTTLVTALLAALKVQRHELSAFKCGPDLIDPLFHREALGIPGYNLDAWFCEEPRLREVLCRYGRERLSIIEGVMGFYDGIGLEGRGSSYDIAAMTETPVILVLDARGMSVSAQALLRGFCRFKEKSMLRGVIFNRVGPGMLPWFRHFAEAEGLRCLGCFPNNPELEIESRRLGLIPTHEIEDMPEVLRRMAEQAAESLDIDGIIELASAARPLQEELAAEDYLTRFAVSTKSCKIAVARDEAFPLHYTENLDLLRAMGAELLWFSPLHDEALPAEADGLMIGTGYPDRYAEALSANQSMRRSVREAVGAGIPTLVEGAGNLYLGPSLKGLEMCGVLGGESLERDSLRHFGYITMRAQCDSPILAEGEDIRCHEFHYWDLSEEGHAYLCRKASGRGEWVLGHASESLSAQWPQLYFPARPESLRRFLSLAEAYHK